MERHLGKKMNVALLAALVLRRAYPTVRSAYQLYGGVGPPKGHHRITIATMMIMMSASLASYLGRQNMTATHTKKKTENPTKIHFLYVFAVRPLDPRRCSSEVPRKERRSPAVCILAYAVLISSRVFEKKKEEEEKTLRSSVSSMGSV